MVGHLVATAGVDNCWDPQRPTQSAAGDVVAAPLSKKGILVLDITSPRVDASGNIRDKAVLIHPKVVQGGREAMSDDRPSHVSPLC